MSIVLCNLTEYTVLRSQSDATAIMLVHPAPQTHYEIEQPLAPHSVQSAQEAGQERVYQANSDSQGRDHLIHLATSMTIDLHTLQDGIDVSTLLRSIPL